MSCGVEISGCGARISVSASTTALRCCIDFDFRCSALRWVVVDSGRYISNGAALQWSMNGASYMWMKALAYVYKTWKKKNHTNHSVDCNTGKKTGTQQTKPNIWTLSLHRHKIYTRPPNETKQRSINSQYITYFNAWFCGTLWIPFERCEWTVVLKKNSDKKKQCHYNT